MWAEPRSPVSAAPGEALRPPEAKGAGTRLKKLEAGLRGLPVPVLGYVRESALHLDLRCLDAGDEPAFVAQLEGLPAC